MARREKVAVTSHLHVTLQGRSKRRRVNTKPALHGAGPTLNHAVSSICIGYCRKRHCSDVLCWWPTGFGVEPVFSVCRAPQEETLHRRTLLVSHLVQRWTSFCCVQGVAVRNIGATTFHDGPLGSVLSQCLLLAKRRMKRHCIYNLPLINHPLGWTSVFCLQGVVWRDIASTTFDYSPTWVALSQCLLLAGRRMKRHCIYELRWWPTWSIVEPVSSACRAQHEDTLYQWLVLMAHLGGVVNDSQGTWRHGGSLDYAGVCNQLLIIPDLPDPASQTTAISGQGLWSCLLLSDCDPWMSWMILGPGRCALLTTISIPFSVQVHWRI